MRRRRVDLADHWVAIVVIGYIWIAAEFGIALAVLLLVA
jgi:hypothetical protein